MTTALDIISDAISALSFTPLYRDDQEFFMPMLGAVPFEQHPASKRDGFEVVMREYRQTAGFGVLGEKESAFYMVVRLGHAPFGTTWSRELYRTADVERVVDVLEAYAWDAGVMSVLFERDEVDKRRANWWITELWFKVVFTGAILA